MGTERQQAHGHQRSVPVERMDAEQKLSPGTQAHMSAKHMDMRPLASEHHSQVPVERMDAEQQRHCALKKWQEHSSEENLWAVILAYAGVSFKTYSGLSFSYEVRKGRNGEFTKELWIDRREKSKSLAWSSVLLALRHIKSTGTVVERPKALGDIRGITYIYAMFYRFGLIDVPDKVKAAMGE